MSLGSKEKNSSEHELPIVTFLSEALRGSSRLGAQTIQIRDISKWYYIRSKLGPKRQTARIIHKKIVPGVVRKYKYTAFMYDIDDLDNSVVRKRIGTYESYLQAIGDLERACKIRDGCISSSKQIRKPIIRKSSIARKSGKTNVSSPFRPLQLPHIYIQIRSSNFSSLSSRERIWFVYEELLSKMTEYDMFLLRKVPLPKISYIGENALLLPHVIHLRSLLPCSLHLDLQAVNIQDYNDEPCKAIDELLVLKGALNERTSSNQVIKNASLFSHSLDDLYEESKSLMINEYVENNYMMTANEMNLNNLSYLKTVVRPGRKDDVITERLRARYKKNSSFSSNSKIPFYSVEVEDDFSFARYQKLTNLLCHHVLRIQRLYRKYFFRKSVLEWYIRQRAACLIQSRYRLLVASKLVSQRKFNIYHASSIIQKYWRGRIGRLYTFNVRSEILFLVLKMQPIIRGIQCRQSLKWENRVYPYLLNIQRVIRGHLARKIIVKVKRLKYQTLSISSATKIQCFYRVQHSKRSFQTKYYHTFVRIPSAIKVQSQWRRFQKALAFRIDMEVVKMVRRVQSLIRGVIVRIHRKVLMYNRFLCSMATRIQSRIRAYRDRELTKLVRSRTQYFMKEIPCAILIQRYYQKFYLKNVLKNRMLMQKNAIRIQLTYRAYRSRLILSNFRLTKLAKELDSAALLLQRHYRGFKGRQKYTIHRRDEIARRLRASRVIIRAWLKLKSMRKVEFLREKWMKMLFMNAFAETMNDKKDVIVDLNSIMRDMSSVQKCIATLNHKIRKLDVFIEQANIRKSKIDEEFENNSMSDNWIEILRNQQIQLTNRSDLAKTEIILYKRKIDEKKVRVSGPNFYDIL